MAPIVDGWPVQDRKVVQKVSRSWWQAEHVHWAVLAEAEGDSHGFEDEARVS